MPDTTLPAAIEAIGRAARNLPLAGLSVHTYSDAEPIVSIDVDGPQAFAGWADFLGVNEASVCRYERDDCSRWLGHADAFGVRVQLNGTMPLAVSA